MRVFNCKTREVNRFVYHLILVRPHNWEHIGRSITFEEVAESSQEAKQILDTIGLADRAAFEQAVIGLKDRRVEEFNTTELSLYRTCK